VGETVGVAVSVGGIGVAVFVGVGVIAWRVGCWTETCSVGVGPPREQAVNANAKIMNMINFFIPDYPQIDGAQWRIIP
jgi:hypothetical protein